MDISRLREGLKGAIYRNEKLYKQPNGLNDLFKGCLEVITTLETCEMPKKKYSARCNQGGTLKEISAYNQAWEDFQPMVAKLQMRVKELEEEVNTELKDEVKWGKKILKLQDENTTLRTLKDNQKSIINSLHKQEEELEIEVHALKAKLDKGRIERVITDYFILQKRWLKNKGRNILFGEDDSKRLAKAIVEDK